MPRIPDLPSDSTPTTSDVLPIVQTASGITYQTTIGQILALSSGGASLPSQTGNAGKYLTTNGTTASWGLLGSLAALNSADLTANVTGILPVANGGTGSSTQNFVDLTSDQTKTGQLLLAPTNVATEPLIVNSPLGTTVNVADFKINGASYFYLTSSGTIHSRQLIPDANNTYNLGISTNYWSNLYASRLNLNSTAYIDGSTAGQLTFTGNLQLNGTKLYGTVTTDTYFAMGGFTVNGVLKMNANKLMLSAASATYPSLNFPTGVAPTTPASGDIWFDGSHLNMRISNTSYQIDQNQIDWAATDNSLISWAYDPAIVNGSATALATAGTLYLVKLKVPVNTTVSNIVTYIAAAGSGLTTGQCFAAIYQNGNLLGTTADQSTNWASTGLLTMPLTASVSVSAGYVYVAYWFNGTTGPSIYRSSGSAIINAGLAAGSGRFGTANAGVTTAAPATLTTVNSFSISYWAGIS